MLFRGLGCSNDVSGFVKFPGLHKTLVVLIQQIAFYLLKGIQNYPDHNEEGCSAKELSKIPTHSKAASYGRKNRDDSQKYSTWECDSINYSSNVLTGLWTWFNSWYKAVIPFHIIGNLIRIDGDGCVKEGENDDQTRKEYTVLPACVIRKGINEFHQKFIAA